MFASWQTEPWSINFRFIPPALFPHTCISPPHSSDTPPSTLPHRHASSCPPLMTLSTFVSPYLSLGCNGVKPDSKRFAYLQPGDIVAVNNGLSGRREGLVVGSHIDHLVCCDASFYAVSSRTDAPSSFQGRQIIEVQLDSQVLNYW